MSDKKDKKIYVDSVEVLDESVNIVKSSPYKETITDIIQKTTSQKTSKQAPRLAFTEDPRITNNYAGIFKFKRNLLPDSVIKQIRVQNMHVAAIARARGNQLSMFGQKRPDRFDAGFEIDIKKEFKDAIEPEQMVAIQERIDRLYNILINCGHNTGLPDLEKMNLAEFLYIQTGNGVSFGRFATEIIYEDNDPTKFHRFRPIDVGTIYRSVKKGEAAEGIRKSSIKKLESITGVKIDVDLLEKDEYPWIQAVDGLPSQAFTSKELIVYNLYPSSDIEHAGYPVTPLDTIVNSIITYQSIEIYNKLYFQNGRAAKGFMVLRSEDADQSTIEDIKQNFNASINNVGNSFRMPVFALGKDDNMEWVSTQPQRKDGEFQFLFEQVVRNILAAFNMSPEEIPGYQHLSRGTSSQSLSESNNEYKLIAARDTGIRPLIIKMQDFLNSKIFPLIDPELSQLCYISLSGFDAETRQQESVRLQQDMPIHMTYDDVMSEVDKEEVGDEMGGAIPFNERYNTLIAAYISTGKIMGHYLNNPSHAVDPMLNYKRDPFYFQNLELMMQTNPLAVKAMFATRGKRDFETLKMLLKDFLEEEENEGK